MFGIYKLEKKTTSSQWLKIFSKAVHEISLN